MRPIRSYLFAPADNPRILDKVFAAGADAVVIDLEDAVAAQAKKEARQSLRRRLETLAGTGRPPLWVRINGLAGGEWRDDLEAVVGPWLAGIRLPKAESPDEVRRVSEVVGGLESAAGLAPHTVTLTLTIESAAGVEHAGALARCDRVDHLCFGNVDYLADIGARETDDGAAALYAHSRVVLASRLAGIGPPIAPVQTRLDDLEALRRSSERFRDLGFFGRSCIHPKQIPVIHRVFTPSPVEVSEAREIVATYQAGLAAGSGSEVTSTGQFVDVAVVRRARAIITLADSLAERDR